MKALSICHNVTPVTEEPEVDPNVINGDIELAVKGDKGKVNFQAASPDEVSVRFAITQIYSFKTLRSLLFACIFT